MSYNDIADFFSQYSSGDSKNCKHLKELFAQAKLQLEEEQEIPVIVKQLKKKNSKF